MRFKLANPVAATHYRVWSIWGFLSQEVMYAWIMLKLLHTCAFMSKTYCACVVNSKLLAFNIPNLSLSEFYLVKSFQTETELAKPIDLHWDRQRKWFVKFLDLLPAADSCWSSEAINFITRMVLLKWEREEKKKRALVPLRSNLCQNLRRHPHLKTEAFYAPLHWSMHGLRGRSAKHQRSNWRYLQHPVSRRYQLTTSQQYGKQEPAGNR